MRYLSLFFLLLFIGCGKPSGDDIEKRYGEIINADVIKTRLDVDKELFKELKKYEKSITINWDYKFVRVEEWGEESRVVFSIDITRQAPKIMDLLFEQKKQYEHNPFTVDGLGKKAFGYVEQDVGWMWVDFYKKGLLVEVRFNPYSDDQVPSVYHDKVIELAKVIYKRM
jgi:hypothetical protein